MEAVRMGNDGNRDDLVLANERLLKKRAEMMLAEKEKYKKEMTKIAQHIKACKYTEAKEIAAQLKDSLVYPEIMHIFKANPQIFACVNCMEPLAGQHFIEDTLTWVNPILCDRCQNKEISEEINRKARLFSDFAERNMKSILRTVGVEGQLIHASYEGFSDEVRQACIRSQMGKHGLYIYGGVGRGKSWLAVALLKATIKTMYQKNSRAEVFPIGNIDDFKRYYRFVYVPWLLTEIKSTYDNSNARSEQDIINEYTNMPVLVLDDIGAERPTDWVREKLNMIIYFRNNRGLKTIYTSNVAPDGLQERLDERITSRILQQCDTIQLTGPDRRRHSN